MADGNLVSRQARIFSIVSAMLAKQGFPGQVEPNQSLQEAGLTSLDLVNLMLAIEAEFDFEVPQDEMTPENFSSVRAIERLLDSFVPA
ncbi:MAG TPA: phosphopantetheine-binding protein [Caulobacteraceae bacterium]|jgi:acyl carrier protein|nr:phosphopantetheine-binding protein [Caulobacteraceae bacterium]